MVDLSALTAFSKARKKDFAQQKRFIARVLSGQQAKCPSCHQMLSVDWGVDSGMSTIQCAKKCTDIQLEVEN